MKKRLKDVLFILVLGSLCVLLLLWIKGYTYPVIARYEVLKLKSTILEAAGIEYSVDNLNELFGKNIQKITKDDAVYYLTPDKFYIFEFEGRGLWGMIRGVITLNPDLKTIESMRIISQEETPGLGGRISEESFLSQFRKKKVWPQLHLVLRRKASGDNEIDSISGASMTSAALIEMINESVEKFRKIVER